MNNYLLLETKEYFTNTMLKEKFKIDISQIGCYSSFCIEYLNKLH
jgi:hypothetical protein